MPSFPIRRLVWELLKTHVSLTVHDILDISANRKPERSSWRYICPFFSSALPNTIQVFSLLSVVKDHLFTSKRKFPLANTSVPCLGRKGRTQRSAVCRQDRSWPAASAAVGTVSLSQDPFRHLPAPFSCAGAGTQGQCTLSTLSACPTASLAYCWTRQWDTGCHLPPPLLKFICLLLILFSFF